MIDLILGFISGPLINGNVELALEYLGILFVVLVVLPAIIIGVFLLASEKEEREVVVSKYSPEQRENMREKSYGCAKRAIIMREFLYLSVKQVLIAGSCMIIVLIGLCLLSAFGKYNESAYDLWLFHFYILEIGIVVGVLQFIWWLAEGIIFNKLCYRTGDDLEEHVKFNLLEHQENLNKNDIKELGDKEKYLLFHNQKLINRSIFKVMNKCGFIIQILVAVGIWVYVLVV